MLAVGKDEQVGEEWQTHFDSGMLWWLGTRSLLIVCSFLPFGSDQEPRALCEGELQRLHLAKVL